MSNTDNTERKMGNWYTEKVEFFVGVTLIVIGAGVGSIFGL